MLVLEHAHCVIPDESVVGLNKIESPLAPPRPPDVRFSVTTPDALTAMLVTIVLGGVDVSPKLLKLVVKAVFNA